MHYCHKCGKELLVDVRVTRYDSCDYCGSDLRCCKNCRFHDPSAYNQCRENITEYITDRAAGNACGSFEYVKGNDRIGKSNEVDEAKKKLSSLFKI